MKMGYLIVIEGTDGCGKKTQTERLYDKLIGLGYRVYRYSFPNYDSLSSGPVKLYLNGSFGESDNSIDAYQASALYAVDRLCSYNIDIKKHYEDNEIVLLDRYTTANMLHQACKITDISARDSFLKWLDEFEFETLKLPRPDKVLFLDLPVEISKRLANERGELKSGEAQDILEKNKDHLTRAYESGKYVAKKYGWTTISCAKDDNIRSIEDIHQDIWASVEQDIISRK